MSQPTKRRSGQRRSARREALNAWTFLAPSLVGVLVFLILPILIVIWLSFQKWDQLAAPTWVGLANWQRVLGDGVLGHSLWITLLFVAMVIPLQTGLGLLMAVLMHRGLPGTTFFRVVYVLPWIAAPLALGVVWKWIFAPYGGALNALLGTNISWLTDPRLALPCVAAVSIWSQVGYVALFFLAGLAAVPRQVLEAASLDGASGWQTFWQIKFPLLTPTMFFVLVTGLISAFQAFDQIYALAPRGGPRGATDVIASRIYSEAFQGGSSIGRAAVMALVLFVLLVIVTLVQQLWFGRRVTYDLG